jgi:hypothetical protein
MLYFYTLKYKLDAYMKLKEWAALIRTQFGKTLKRIRTDSSREWLNQETKKFAIEKGIATFSESGRCCRTFDQDYRRTWAYYAAFCTWPTQRAMG